MRIQMVFLSETNKFFNRRYFNKFLFFGTVQKENFVLMCHSVYCECLMLYLSWKVPLMEVI